MEIYNEIESKIITMIVHYYTFKEIYSDEEVKQREKIFSTYYKISRRDDLYDLYDLSKIKVTVFKLINLFDKLTKKLIGKHDFFIKNILDKYTLIKSKTDPYDPFDPLDPNPLMDLDLMDITTKLIQKINEYYIYTYAQNNYLEITDYLEITNKNPINYIETYIRIEDCIRSVLTHYKMISPKDYTLRCKRYISITKRADTYDNDNNQVKILSCGHFFHCTCIEPWLLNCSNLCPICRIKI
jgi:hypothetical protein